jgi:hypothetical protein
LGKGALGLTLTLPPPPTPSARGGGELNLTCERPEEIADADQGPARLVRYSGLEDAMNEAMQ